MFCDTDVLTTTVWSDVLFGGTPGWIRELAEQRTYDLYLVTDVDVPDSTIVTNPDLVTSQAMSTVWQRIHGSATTGQPRSSG